MRLKNISILVIITLSLSCKKFLDIPAPKTQTETGKVFSNDQAAISAVTGLYSEMTKGNLNLMNGGQTVYPALSADELYNTSPNADLDMFSNNSILSTNGAIYSRLWSQGYKNIYHANAVLEGIQHSTSLTDSISKQLRGEMLLVRAFNYFYLIQLFGDVPLQLTTDFERNSIMSRTPIAEIYEQLKNDLTEAKSLMSTYYPFVNRTRPNKWSAATMLARVYLFNEEWQKAEAEATAVIQSGYYSLVMTLNNVFIPGSNETIWQMSRDNNNTAEGGAFIPSSATVRPTYSLRMSLINTFDINDQRKANWIKQQVVSGQAYYYPYKYKVRTSSPISEYYVVFRLAEVYLIRAEARAQQNNTPGAVEDINIIRQRAGLSNTTANDKPSLLPAIAQERQFELFTEWGHRWGDLKRTKMADLILANEKGVNWQPTDKLYPLPQDELNTNPFLTQNPGY